MKVSYNGSESVHKDVYRNLMYTGDNKYSFVGESGFDNSVGACTQAPNFTEYSGGDDPGDEYWGLCFTAVEPNSSVSFNSSDFNGGHPVIEGAPQLSTSTDEITWTPYEYGTEIQLANIGDKVYFAARDGVTNSTPFTDGESYSHGFLMTGKISASGEVFSLIVNDESQLSTYQLSAGHLGSLFSSCISLTTAPRLSIVNLAAGCYYGMFRDCTSLTIAPELPATTLAGYCYNGMFRDCTSLTIAPELPDTTLAEGCYAGMFEGCTSLTTAPELPATTLAGYCYSQMFRNCKNLINAPELPDTTLAEGCYAGMFEGCTSLTTAPELPATTLAGVCYNGMFEGCTSLTTAPELLATTLVEGCYAGMFKGCTSLTTAPELPATTLDAGCYNGMFSDCTSLINAPELPATTLVAGCYNGMFYECHNLNSVTVGFTSWLSNATNAWLSGVSSTGTFKCPAALGTNDTITRGTSNCPEGWTVVNNDTEINIE